MTLRAVRSGRAAALPGTAALLVTAALALAGGGGSDSPRLRATAAGDLTLQSSHDGQAILTASDLAPGEVATGVLTLTNTAPEDRALQLVTGAPADTPGPGGAPLSHQLDLVVERVGVVGPPVWSGKLRDVPVPLALPDLPGGGSTGYRLTAALPEHGPAIDDAYAGASVTLDLTWEAGAVGSTPPRAPDPEPAAPETPVQTPAAAPQPQPDQPRAATPGPLDPGAEGPAAAAGGAVRLWLGGERRQSLVGRQLALFGRCRPGCRLVAGGVVRAGGRRIRLRSRSLGTAVAHGPATRLAFRLTVREARLIARLRRRGGVARIDLTVRGEAPAHRPGRRRVRITLVERREGP